MYFIEPYSCRASCCVYTFLSAVEDLFVLKASRKNLTHSEKKSDAVYLGNEACQWITPRYILPEFHDIQKQCKQLGGADVYTKSVKNVHCDSSDGQDSSLPLPPPLLPLIQFARGLGEEHHVLSALDLPLEELQRRAVEAHHVLRHTRRRKRWWGDGKSAFEDEESSDDKLFQMWANPLFQMLLTLISRTFESVPVRSSSMTESSIWLLEIWPKWILQTDRQQCQLGRRQQHV